MITLCGIYSLIAILILAFVVIKNSKENRVRVCSIIILAPVIIFVAYNLFYRMW